MLSGYGGGAAANGSSSTGKFIKSDFRSAMAVLIKVNKEFIQATPTPESSSVAVVSEERD